jgi:hypothetical protein
VLTTAFLHDEGPFDPENSLLARVPRCLFAGTAGAQTPNVRRDRSAGSGPPLPRLSATATVKIDPDEFVADMTAVANALAAVGAQRAGQGARPR